MKCVYCENDVGLTGFASREVAPGDAFLAVRDTFVYAWGGPEGQALRPLLRDTRVVAVDRLPPPWWKGALQPGRFRAFLEPDAILYADLSLPEFERAGALCPEHLDSLTTHVRREDGWRRP